MSILTHLKCAARNWGNQFDRKALILMYHRVAEVDADPWGLCVTPQHFREQLDILRKTCRTLPLMKLKEELVNGKVPRRCVVVTFDDGYEDNLLRAKPELEKNEIPATFFLVSGQIGKSKEFWWDELERIFLKTESLPDELELNIDGRMHVWRLNPSPEFPRNEKDSKWRTDLKPPTNRHFTYLAVWQLLQPLEESQKQAVLDQLRHWSRTQAEVRLTHKTMTREEVCALGHGGLVEIGAHTVSHPMLSKFSVESQRQEVVQSKLDLEELINRPVRTFAYPHGEYSDQTLTVLREAKLQCACSTAPVMMNAALDPLRLPRFQAQDWDGDQFSQHLSEWFREK